MILLKTPVPLPVLVFMFSISGVVLIYMVVLVCHILKMPKIPKEAREINFH